jgi:hypothetical protein
MDNNTNKAESSDGVIYGDLEKGFQINLEKKEVPEKGYGEITVNIK